MPSAEPPRGRPLRLAIVVLALTLFGCDHATKLAAEATLANGRNIDVVRGILDLRYATNFDTAFGLLSRFGVARTPLLLLAASLVALLGVVVVWVAARKRATTAQHVGFALILAGAVGNVVDRVTRGYVVDFIHLTHWPIFNVADVGVVVGTLALGFGALSAASAAPRPDPPHRLPPPPPPL